MLAEEKAEGRTKERDREAQHDGHERSTHDLNGRFDRAATHQRRMRSVCVCVCVCV